MIGRNPHAVVFIHGFAVGIAGGLRDPSPVAGAENRLQRRYQAAGGNRAFDRTGPVEVLIRFSVGDREQAVSAQPALYENAKTIGRPIGFSRFAQARFLFGRRARGHQAGGKARHFARQRFKFAGRRSPWRGD